MFRLLAVLLVLPVVSFAQEKKGVQYAFLVGCSGYSETQLKPLPYTVNDVEQFRAALLDTGFEPENVKMLHDKRDYRYLPDRAKIMKEFRTLLAGLNAEDTVVVALSGHGVHFKKDPTGYFCPLDADLKDKSTLIPFEGRGGLFETLKACKAKRKLMIVNACRNDPTSDRALAAEKIDLDDAVPETVPEGIAAIYSCREGQKSYYDPKRQRSIFFDHVTRAWRGEYAKDQDHTNIEDFFRETSRRTKQDADQTYSEAQVPEVKREYREEWKLVNLSAITADFAEWEDYLRAWGDPRNWILQVGPSRFPQWRKLAEAGNLMGMQLTALCYYNGGGVTQDQKQAVAWYRKSADRGGPWGMNNLGICYNNGNGVTKDHRQAAGWYRKSAEHGNSWGMLNYGHCLERGTGVDKDERQAMDWYLKSIDLGNTSAMLALGGCHLRGAGGTKDERRAAELFRQAADLGQVTSMVELGFCFENGQGVSKDDTQAVQWHRKAADLGHATAMNQLGVRHVFGRGVEKDGNLSRELFEKAAARGLIRAMLNLGDCHATGKFGTKNEAAAVEWYRKAARLGNAEATEALKRLNQ